MNPPGAKREGAPQGNGVVRASLQPDMVRAGSGKRTGTLFSPARSKLGDAKSDIAASGVYQHSLA
jgi:hypothetical protein